MFLLPIVKLVKGLNPFTNLVRAADAYNGDAEIFLSFAQGDGCLLRVEMLH